MRPTDPDDVDGDSAERRDRLACERDVAATSTGFVWCEPVPSDPDGERETRGFEWCEPVPSDPDGERETRGFEWCEPKADDATAATPTETREVEEDATGADTTEGGDEDDAGDDLLLDPEIVTTTRATGIDDDTVALLSALRANHAARVERDGDRQ